QSYLAQLLVPGMHAAWVRTQLQRRAEANGGGGERPRAASILHAPELDILEWIYLGKSNYEIGAILKISPLTVKNHVQKILRKLNVVNRTQAIGKALELRILNQQNGSSFQEKNVLRPFFFFPFPAAPSRIRDAIVRPDLRRGGRGGQCRNTAL